eukprot:gene13996-870_t
MGKAANQRGGRPVGRRDLQAVRKAFLGGLITALSWVAFDGVDPSEHVLYNVKAKNRIIGRVALRSIADQLTKSSNVKASSLGVKVINFHSDRDLRRQVGLTHKTMTGKAGTEVYVNVRKGGIPYKINEFVEHRYRARSPPAPPRGPGVGHPRQLPPRCGPPPAIGPPTPARGPAPSPAPASRDRAQYGEEALGAVIKKLPWGGLRQLMPAFYEYINRKGNEKYLGFPEIKSKDTFGRCMEGLGFFSFQGFCTFSKLVFLLPEQKQPSSRPRPDKFGARRQRRMWSHGNYAHFLVHFGWHHVEVVPLDRGMDCEGWLVFWGEGRLDWMRRLCGKGWSLYADGDGSHCRNFLKNHPTIPNDHRVEFMEDLELAGGSMAD